MSVEGWVCPITAVVATGNLTQLYPAWVTAGVAKAGSTNGQLLRRPLQGALHAISVEADGSNGGIIQIYDIDGGQNGADVSSGTAITDAQLTAALAATPPRAKLIFEQQFAGTVGSGPISPPGVYIGFMKGLAARMVMDTPPGSCKLNLRVGGGYEKVESRGGY